jgi:hypothetical protein
MSDATRNVTILLSVKAGTIEAPDLSPWAAAKAAVSDVNTGMKSLAETQKELAATEQTLGQAARQTVEVEDQKAKMHKAVEVSAKQSADVQVEQSNRVVETVAKNMRTIEEMTARRPLREPGQATVSPSSPEDMATRRPLREPGESGPSSQQTIISPTVEARQSSLNGLKEFSAGVEAEIDANMQKYEKDQLARQQKQAQEQQRMMLQEAAEIQRAEEQMAAAIIRTRSALNKQRVREHEDEQAAIQRETELSIAEAQKQTEQEQAAFEEAEQMRADEQAAVEAQTQREIAENEKALQKQTADEMKFRENMRNQRIREEDDTAAQAAKEQAERDKAQQKQAAAELKFRQDMRNQRIEQDEEEAEAAREQAESILEFRARMNQQRLREEEATANAVVQAQNRLPGLLRGVQQDMSQVIGATAQFASHLSMLDSIGGESLENIAKKFAEIQSTVGLISSSQSIFSNVGEGLGKLQQMGTATQTLVAQQQALGVATTFSQAATLRLAGAAGTLQVALGPISLIMTGIMAAIVIAEIAMDSYGETAEDVAAKQQEYLKQYNDDLDKIIKKMERERDIMSEQSDILGNQWELKKLLLGDTKQNTSDMLKENKEKTAQNDEMMETAVDNGLNSILNSGLDDKYKQKQKQIDAEKKQAEANRQLAQETLITEDLDYEGRRHFEDQVVINQNALNDLEAQQAALDTQTGVAPMAALANTQVEGGMIVDFEAFNANLQALPQHMQDEAREFLKLVADQQQMQMQTDKQSLGEAQRALADAEANKKKAEQGIITEEKRFNAEEDLATKFGLTEGGFAKQEALSMLDQFDAAKDPEQKAVLADQAERALREQGLLSAEADAMLRGANTDTSAVRAQIKDDSEISDKEKTQNDKNVADLTALKMEADSAIATMPRLIEDLKAKMKHIADQQTALQNAIRVRDGI